MKKQSRADRLKRLKEGACPIHGLFMSQIDVIWINPCSECGNLKSSVNVVGCPRKDCDIYAYTENYEAPRILPPELMHLLEITN